MSSGAYTYTGKRGGKMNCLSVISSRENELQAYQQNTDRGRPSEAKGKDKPPFPVIPITDWT